MLYQTQAQRNHLIQKANEIFRIECFGIDFLHIDFRKKGKGVINQLNGDWCLETKV